MRLARRAAALLIALPLTLALSQPAFAHSRLLSSDPENGAHLSAAPTKVTLTFSDPVDVKYATLALTVGTGEPTSLELTADGGVLTGRVPGNDVTGDGAAEVPWQITYRVTSKDGHPISGVVQFTVAATKEVAATPTPVETSASADTLAPTASSSIDASDKTDGSFTGVMITIPLLLVAAGAVAVIVMRQRRHGRS